MVGSVRDHVRQRALEQTRVGEDGWERFLQVKRDVGSARTETAQRSRQHLVEIDGFLVDLERVSLQAAHIEEVAHEGVQAVGLLVDRVEKLAPFVRAPVDVLLKQARDRGLDARKRRTQVV